jgi:hypothetical protein
MKADVQSQAEKEALEWATNFFRNCAEELRPKGSKRVAMEFGLGMLLNMYDYEMKNRPEQLDQTMVRLINRLKGSDLLPQFVVVLMEEGVPLPAPLRLYAAAFLHEPDTFQPKIGI